MEINQLCDDAYEASRAAGWHEHGKERTEAEAHWLVCTEMAEATESVRDHKPPYYMVFQGQEVVPGDPLWDNAVAAGCKPEGEAVEIADATIRIGDIVGKNRAVTTDPRLWDLEAIIAHKMRYNRSRGYRHGGKAL